MNSPAAPLPFRSVSRRLVRGLLLCGIVFTLLTSATQLWLTYGEEKAEIERQFALIDNSIAPSLGACLWEVDAARCQELLHDITRLPSISHAELLSATGQQWRSHSHLLTGHAHVSRSFVLHSSQSALTVGTLTVAADEERLQRRLQRDAIGILASQALQFLLLALLIGWATEKLLTRHLTSLAHFASQISASNLNRALHLGRNSGQQQDELDLLVDALNKMQQRLVEHLQRQQQYEAELAHHRDELSEQIAFRTADLAFLSGFQSQLSRLSANLLCLPLHKLDSALQDGLRRIALLIGADAASVYLTQPHNGACWLSTDGASPPGAQPDAQALDALFALFALMPEPVWAIDNMAQAQSLQPLLPHWPALSVAQSALLVQLRQGEQIRGLLLFTSYGHPRCWRRLDKAPIQLTAEILVNTLLHRDDQSKLQETEQTLREANSQLERLIRYDSLTGIANRRYFDEVKDAEFQRAYRNKQPLSLLMCDIDHFKQYNDRYGHPAGDQCLRQIGQLFSQHFHRAGELPARVGGEEFAVLLPGATAAQAMILAEALRQAVYALAIPHERGGSAGRVTLSIGVCGLDLDLHPNIAAMISTADLALYQAKAAGRNRIEQITLTRHLAAPHWPQGSGQ